MNRQEIALKLLDLETLEIEEILSSLFRRSGYRIVETLLNQDILYFHLTDTQEEKLRHTIACWVSDEKMLLPQKIVTLFKNSPWSSHEEIVFESAILLTPYTLPEPIRQEIKPTGIELVDGSRFLDLLDKFEVPYRIPTSWNVFTKKYGKKIPFFLIPVFLVLTFFVYKSLLKNSPASSSSNNAVTPLPLSSSPLPQTTPQSNPQTLGQTQTPPTPSPTPMQTSAGVALPTPSTTANPQTTSPKLPPKAAEKTKSAPIAPKKHVIISKKIAVKEKTLKPPKNQKAKVAFLKNTKPQMKKSFAQSYPTSNRYSANPVQRVSIKKQKKKSLHKKSLTVKPIPYNAPQRIAERVERYYTNIFDLDKKYYLMGLDFQHRHLYGLAREYFQKSLEISPNGPYSAKAQNALKSLPK
jgi:hypothetical protein